MVIFCPFNAQHDLTSILFPVKMGGYREFIIKIFNCVKFMSIGKCQTQICLLLNSSLLEENFIACREQNKFDFHYFTPLSLTLSLSLSR